MYIYVIFWILIQYYGIYFVDQMAPTSATGSPFRCELLCPFDTSPSVCLVSTSLLVEQDVPGLTSVLPVPALASGISPRSPGSFYSRVTFRNQGNHQFLTPSLIKQGS